MHAEKVCHKWLSDVLSGMHQKRLSALSAVVAAAMSGGKLAVTSIGRAIGGNAKTKHNIKRADRLISNRHLQESRFETYTSLARRTLAGMKQATIVVDWSDVDARREFFILRASLPKSGRSATVYEEVHSRRTREKRKTHAQFLDNLGKVLPAGLKPVLVTDAGFRNPWFKAVKKRGWDFVGRVRGRELVSLNSQWMGAKSLYRKATSTPRNLNNALLVRSNALRCSLVLYKEKRKGRKCFTKMKKLARSRRSLVNAARAREPWLLATSLALPAQNIVDLYSSRMQIEESFRDLKCARYGLALENTGTYKLERMKILLLIGSLATMIAWHIGTLARTLNIQRDFQVNTVTRAPVLSNIFLGLHLIRRMLPHYEHLWVQLF